MFRRNALAALTLLLAAACARCGGAPASASALAEPAGPPFDPTQPGRSLGMDADVAAHRLGSFEWTAGVEWTVARQGSAERVRAVERHRLVQSATGEFLVESEVDPGLGEGSQTGRDVIWAGNMTYARGKWAPWRERPTDRGRDAKRFRAESFNAAAEVAGLLGPKLGLSRAGEATLLGRSAIRYAIALDADASERAAPPETRLFPEGGPDADTKVRLSFLDGAQPVSAKGELLLDAQTGVPLRVSLDAAFGVKADPRARIQLSLRAQLKGVGTTVPAVAAPKDPLPDERKPRGVADALERAGLKTKAEGGGAKGEPVDDADQ